MLNLVGDPPDYVIEIHSQLKQEMLSAVEAVKKFKLNQADERSGLFAQVDTIISENHFLVSEFYNGLEPPLSIAAGKLCPELVKICIKHGADPLQQFPCSKKGHLSNALLTASDAYRAKLFKWREDEKTEQEYFNLYVAVIEPMRQITPIAHSASSSSQ